MDNENERVNRLHHIWWDFSNYMKQLYSNGNGDFDSEQMIGSDASDTVYEYAKTHPEIYIVPCDDSYFMGSDIVLIPHPEMGITAIYIPQCCNSINKFFLYPGHIEHLIKTIEEIKSKYL